MAINLNKIRGDRAYRFVVREGDTLSSLAELLGVEQRALREANPDLELDMLVPGTDLVIPEAKAVDEAADESGEEAALSVEEHASVEAPDDDPQTPGSGLEELEDELADIAIRRTDATRPKVIALRVVDEPEISPADDGEAESSLGKEEAALQVQDEKPDTPTKLAAESREASETQSAPKRFEPVSWKPFPKI